MGSSLNGEALQENFVGKVNSGQFKFPSYFKS